VHRLAGSQQRWITGPATVLRRGAGDHQVHAAWWQGSPGGTPFVCVHGLGGSHLNWSAAGPRLSALGPGWGDVWAVDLAGFGLTPLAGRRASIGDNLDLLAGFVRTIVSRQPTPTRRSHDDLAFSGSGSVVLLGNSMGGLIAMTLAARLPELVAGLVLVNPALADRRKVDPEVALRFAAFLTPGVGEAWLRRLSRRTTPQEQVRQTMGLVLADPDGAAADLLEAHADLVAARRSMPHAHPAFLQAARSMLHRLLLRPASVTADAAGVQAPTLLVHGGGDRLVGERPIRQLAARRPDWRLLSYPDLGHVPMLEKPDRFVRDVAAWLPAVRTGQAAGR
jgi:pimeloyl-ACP methyl ester carboxylesterase